MRILIRPLLFFLFSFLCLTSVWAADLKTFEDVYEKESQEILKSFQPKFDGLQEQYQRSLEAFKTTAQNQGDLTKIKAAIAEIERFRKAKSLPATLDEKEIPEIKALQSAYVKQFSVWELDMTAKLGALTTHYEQALDRLQKELVRALKLDEATAVQAEKEKAQVAVKGYADQLATLKGSAATNTSKQDGASPVVSPQAQASLAEDRKIEQQLAASIESAKQKLSASPRPMAIVALYADTDDPNDSVPQNRIEYRCYSGGGYSGVMYLPFRQAWTRPEYVYPGRDGARRIQLDPGPPYEIINREVAIKEGEVTNLGRVVLKKVIAEGTASLYGTVQDGAGNPMSNVRVSAGDKQTVTSRDGQYKLSGFGLEVVTLKASQTGYFGGEASVSIRNMDNREIRQDLRLFRPCRLTLRYVIGKRMSNALDGPGVEQGTLKVTADSTRVELRRREYTSASFGEFVEKTHLYLSFRSGKLTFSHFMAPIFYQAKGAEVPFDSITEAEGFEAQQCPPLEQGGTILIRGFRKNAERGVADFCVKIFVEELAVE